VNAPLGVVFAGDPGIPAGGVPRVWTNFGPRMGFAWDVFGNGKTSVRGGYGIFFDSANTIMMNNQGDQSPYGTVLTTFGTINNSFADPYRGTVNPFPASHTNFASNVSFPQFTSPYMYATDYRNPYIQAWNFSVERELAGGFFTRASYAGSKGTKLTVVREINSAVYAPGATTGTTNQRRPFAPALGGSSIVEPAGNSVYHALQLNADKRFSHGFSILANYQFSKSLDDSSNSKATGTSRTNPFNQRFDRGPSNFDRTHVFNLSGLWELPIHFHNRVSNSLLGGWSLNGIVSEISGYPFTVTSGVDNALTGTGGQRADLVANPYFSGDRSKAQKLQAYLNPAAFALNAVGTYGALGRNVFRAWSTNNIDAGIFKTFTIYERLTATLRFEAFNALNHPNFYIPTATKTSGNFMKTTIVGDPRILQMALRLKW